MVKTKQPKDSEEAKRWLIIGAHKAGASEKKMARLSGLSKQVIRHIILNYQKTGKPSLPKKDSKNTKNKLIVEYDEDGELVDDDSEDESNNLKAIKSTKDLINYTKLKINKKPSSPQDKEEQESSPEQTIQGYELWTNQDDTILLRYVLNNLQNSNGWNELQVRFDGKHSARTCYQRWQRLKSLLIKNMDTTI